MQYRSLGESPLKVSVVGLGTMPFGGTCDEVTSAEIVNTALDLGINFIDTADIYGRQKAIGLSEEYIGRAIKGRRGEAIIATKGSIRFNDDGTSRSDASRRYLMEAAEGSLRRLGTDHIDLYQIHIPDPTTPIEETLRTLDDLVRSGKVRYTGCVNYQGWQLADAGCTARTERLSPFISSQNRYNLLDRGAEAEIFLACERFGMGFIPYLPLAGGLLTGKYRLSQPAPAGARLSGPAGSRTLTETNLEAVARLDALATARGHSLLELAMSWLIARPLIGTVIAGATSPDQVKANARAAQWEMTGEDLAAVDAALRAEE